MKIFRMSGSVTQTANVYNAGIWLLYVYRYVLFKYSIAFWEEKKKRKKNYPSLLFAYITIRIVCTILAMLLCHNWIEIDLHRVNLMSKWFSLFDVANEGFQRGRLLNRQTKQDLYLCGRCILWTNEQTQICQQID